MSKDRQARRSRSQSQNCARRSRESAHLAAEPIYEHNFSLTTRIPSHVKVKPGVWLWDSGASSHMCADREVFSSMKKIKPIEVMTGNGPLYAEFCGEVPLTLCIDNHPVTVCLHNVLYMPDLTGSRHLFSINVLTKLGLRVMFDQSKVVALSKDGKTVATGTKILGTNSWILDQDEDHLRSTRQRTDDTDVCMMTLKGKVDRQSLDLWHQQLGHLNKNAIAKLQKMSIGIEIGSPLQKHKNGCVNCLRGVFPKMISRFPMLRATVPGERVHMDLSGKIPRISIVGGFLYFAVIVDEYTRYTLLYPLVKKSDIQSAFKAYKARFETQHAGLRLQCAHADNGTEFLGTEFRLWLQQNGIILETTQYYSPDQNGIAERAIGVVTAHASAMLATAEIPIEFWPQACLCAVFLKNRAPTSALDQHKKTPYKMYFQRVPTMGYLRVFGCRAWGRIPHEKRKKFDDAAFECLFMGYLDTENLFSVWDINKQCFARVRDVKFYEDTLGHPLLKRLALPKGKDLFGNKLEIRDNRDVDEMSDSEDEWVDDHEEIPLPDEQVEPRGNLEVEPVVPAANVLIELHQPRKKSFTNTRTQQLGLIATEIAMEEIEDTGLNRIPTGVVDATTNVDTERMIQSVLRKHSVTSQPSVKSAVQEPLPTSYAAAMKSPNVSHWLYAMATELRGLLEQNTYTLIDTSKLRTSSGVPVNVIPAKWVYDYKYKIDGSIKRFKARWVARGDLQKYGLDYRETFAPVAKITTLRVLLTIAAANDWEVEHMDVVTAFLYPTLENNVYLQQPLGFRIDSRSCKLNKSLYGLCQAAREWYNMLNGVLGRHGFRRMNSDYALW